MILIRNGAKTKVLFLGHWISKGVIQMDQEKIRSIVDWEVPKKERAGSCGEDARSHFRYNKNSSEE